MKLLYATSIDLPSVRANRIQIVSMAQAFGKQLGGGFILGLKARGPVSLSCRHVEFRAERSIALAWVYLSLARQEGVTHVYCREERLLFFMIFFNTAFFRLPLRFVYELHELRHTRSWWFRPVLRRAHRVVSITAGMTQALVAAGYPAERVLVAPDAVDAAAFDVSLTVAQARERLGLPQEKRIAMYTGSIDEPWKGVGVFYEAACVFGSDYYFVIVGGKPHYVDYFNSMYPPRQNVMLVGHRAHDDIPLYLRAADVLVLPNSAKQEISRVSTSPMKLFEYMAAGKPIVASDLPSLREVLNESNALLVSADDPQALAAGIRRLTEDGSLAAALAAQARRDVLPHTWERRAKLIISFIV